MLSWRLARQREGVRSLRCPARSSHPTSWDSHETSPLPARCTAARRRRSSPPAAAAARRAVPSDSVAVVGNDQITKARVQLPDRRREEPGARREDDVPEARDGRRTRRSRTRRWSTSSRSRSSSRRRKDLGIESPTPTSTSRSTQIKKQYFGGNEKTFQTQLEAAGPHRALLEIYQRGNLLSDKLYKKVTDDVKVTDADVKKYYDDEQVAVHEGCRAATCATSS